MLKKSMASKKIISSLVIISILFSLLSPLCIFAGEASTVTITEELINENKATIKGSISINKKAHLNLDVKKNGEAFYNESFYTADNGAFSVSFDVDAPQTESDRYAYTLSELKGEDEMNTVHEQDFSKELPAYTVNTGMVDDTLGKAEPSYQLGDRKRLLYQHSSAITAGIYTVETDLYFNSVPTSNGNIFMATNVKGDGTDADNGAGAHYAYIVDVNSGKLRIRYADTNVTANQTATNKYATIIESIDKEVWYKIKIVMNLDTLEMNVFLNDTEVLKDTEMYIFKQKTYTRIFDTSGAQRPEVYLDNIKILNVVKGTSLGIESVVGEIVQYGTEAYRNATGAVNGADEETIVGILEENKGILGIDISKYNELSPEAKDLFEAAMIGDYDDVSEIKTAYDETCAYADIRCAEGDELASKLSVYHEILNVPVNDDFYEDSSIIGCINANMSVTSKFSDVQTLVAQANDLFTLKNTDSANLASVESFMGKYGYNVSYNTCDDSIKSAIRAEKEGFEFDYAKSPAENLRLWAAALNTAYVEANRQNSDYSINVSEYKVVANEIIISGFVEPKVEYDFIATATQNNEEKGKKAFKTDADGKFNFKLTLPETQDDIDYSIKIEAVVPEENPNYLFEEYYDGTENNSYTVSENIDIVNDKGLPVPALKVSKEAEEDKNARQLVTVTQISTLSNGVLCINANFMKPEKSASILYRVADSTGNTNAITLASEADGKLVLNYYDSSKTIKKAEIIPADDFETNNWYSLSIKMDIKTKKTVLTVDNNEFSFISGIDITNLTRAYDTIATSPAVHYMDNIVVYQDTAKRIDAAEDIVVVTVYGTKAISNAITTVKNATTDTIMEAIKGQNHIFEIDFTDYDTLNQNSTVIAALADDDSYVNVEQIRKVFYTETALQKMKETSDNKAKADILKKYSDYIEVSKTDVLPENSVYLSLLGANIANVSDRVELKSMATNLVLAARLMSATQFTVQGVVDANITALKNLGLKSQYDGLNPDQKSRVCNGVFDVSEDVTALGTLLSDIVRNINSKIDAELVITPIVPTVQAGQGNSSNSSSYISPDVNTKPVEVKPAEIFKDVQESHWAYESVNYLAKKGIIDGKSDNSFEPDTTVKREEFVKMIVVALGKDLVETKLNFEDVPSDGWYAGYIATAVEAGIVNGITDTMFGVNKDITRQDALTLLYRCRKALNAGLTEERAYTEFADSGEISDYATEAVEFFYRVNVVDGFEDNTFAPFQSLTRAQAAKMIYEIIRL